MDLQNHSNMEYGSHRTHLGTVRQDTIAPAHQDSKRSYLRGAIFSDWRMGKKISTKLMKQRCSSQQNSHLANSAPPHPK